MALALGARQTVEAISRRKQSGPSELVEECYATAHGRMLIAKVEDALNDRSLSKMRGKVNLILTSPPFPLVTKKQYGNETGDGYLSWLTALAPRLSELLADDGSIVLEIGNAWVKSLPVMSTLPLEALLAFKRAANLHLCQQIICHNPARLPGPAAWVNVKRIRLKDSFTHVWWMSRSTTPKADNRRVLTPYSADMRKLLKTQHYNSGRRPSGHVISERGFLTDHGGAIAPNVVDLELDKTKLPAAMLKFSGTVWDGQYRKYCEAKGLTTHPARMQVELAAFFTEFLTDPGDTVLDPFAGSNTTGAVAERLQRRWLSVEARSEYALGSYGRFES
jgi:hypothetical protein